MSHCGPEGALTPGCFLSTYCVPAARQKGSSQPGPLPAHGLFALLQLGPRPPGESPQHPLILRFAEVCPGCAQVRKLKAPLV